MKRKASLRERKIIVKNMLKKIPYCQNLIVISKKKQGNYSLLKIFVGG